MNKYKNKILYVEDEIKIQQTMEKIFLMFFENFLVASDGQEALEIYKNNKDIELIITDIEMPNLDGIEMIKEIRKENETLPIFVATAYPVERYKDSINDLKINEYIVKPTRFNELIELVKEELKLS